eukprot:1869123-Rhodomonas_salina.2
MECEEVEGTCRQSVRTGSRSRERARWSRTRCQTAGSHRARPAPITPQQDPSALEDSGVWKTMRSVVLG